MKHIYVFAAFALMVFSACSTDEEVVAEQIQEQPAEFYSQLFAAPEFPEADKSTDLKNSDKNVNLSKLIKALDINRALNLKEFELTDDQLAAIKAKAEEICEGKTTDKARIAALNDWVHANVKYDYTPNDPWSVFTHKTGVCQGYANLLKVMLVSVGIPAVNVNGWLDWQYAHAWTYACAQLSTGNVWYVCDPTNKTGCIAMTSTSSYSHLQPDMADVVFFSDENFDYNYYEGYLNVCKVKRGMTNLVVPYSVNNFRVAMFNPFDYIPTSIRNIYLGSNIKSLGQNIVGLTAYPSFDEMCFVDPANTMLGSDHGIIYWKDAQGKLTSLYYIPAMMTTITMLPMETVEKNTILSQQGVETIVFPEGTKYLEDYAIEDCPKLRTVYVPEDCTLAPQAIYRCPDNVEVVYGIPSGIVNIKM